jgi:hypothetical protein
MAAQPLFTPDEVTKALEAQDIVALENYIRQGLDINAPIDPTSANVRDRSRKPIHYLTNVWRLKPILAKFLMENGAVLDDDDRKNANFMISYGMGHEGFSIDRYLDIVSILVEYDDITDPNALTIDSFPDVPIMASLPARARFEAIVNEAVARREARGGSLVKSAMKRGGTSLNPYGLVQPGLSSSATKNGNRLSMSFGSQTGGENNDEYYVKYRKYKIKYLQLKNN